MALNYSQYNTILRTYEQKQLRSREELEARYQEVYSRIPEVKKIENAISSLSVQQARKLLEGNADALSVLKEEIHTLSARKSALLKEAGFPSDYLEPIYECSACKDTGYIDGQKCQCFKKATIDLLYTQSNLSSILEEENFNTFSLKYYSDNHVDPRTGRSSLSNMKEALMVCKEFTNSFGKDFQNLLFYGDTGVGKTFLSHCIAKELIDKAFSVIYFSADQFFDMIAESKYEKNPESQMMHEHIFDCDLLIIDDLGSEVANSLTTSQLFVCINERLLRKKPTIISTNLSMQTLKEVYSERTFSRITSNYTLLKLTGDDIRIKKKLMNKEG